MDYESSTICRSINAFSQRNLITTQEIPSSSHSPAFTMKFTLVFVVCAFAAITIAEAKPIGTPRPTTTFEVTGTPGLIATTSPEPIGTPRPTRKPKTRTTVEVTGTPGPIATPSPTGSIL